MVRDGMTELETVRAQGKAYAKSFGVDVVIINSVPLSFHPVGLAPEGFEELEIITRHFTG